MKRPVNARREVLFLLSDVARAMHTYIDQRGREHGMTRAQWSALARLERHEGMTQAEMACCKKMAGDCKMGAEQHPCCKTVSSSPSPVASVQSKIHFQPLAGVVGLVTSLEVTLVSQVDQTLGHLGLPPPAPPGPSSILRI